MATKIADDFELQVTRERLKGAYRALELSGGDTDHGCIEGILFAIISLQGQIIEYLGYKLEQQSELVSVAAYTVADQLPKELGQSAQIG